MWFILFLLFTAFASGQTTYESPFTQFLSSGGDIEPFQRTISVFPEEIRITSTIKTGRIFFLSS